MMKLTGAIFDLDGTLLNSMPVWASLGENYLKSKGAVPRGDVRERLKPMNMQQAAKYFQTDYHLTESADKIVREIDDMIEQKYRAEIQLKPGVLPFLQKLKRENIKLCIATATDRLLAESALKRLQVADYFSFLITCTEIGFSKESGEIYEKALKLLHTEKAQTVVFEDALHAAKSAKNAGFSVIGVYDECARPEETEIKSTVDRYIRSFEECEEYIL